MIYSILAKLFSTSVACILLINHDFNPYIQAILIGAVPIWSEVLTTYLTKVEPAREKRRRLLFLDACVDTFSFLLAPTTWFILTSDSNSMLLHSAVCVFVVSGLLRIRKFLKDGLDTNGNFTGLPVTYTGYVWLTLTPIKTFDSTYIPSALLIFLSWAMLSKKIKIPASL